MSSAKRLFIHVKFFCIIQAISPIRDSSKVQIQIYIGIFSHIDPILQE